MESAALPTLFVEGLTVEREGRPIVQDISFSLAAGTDTAIVGPNGAGKSTLVQAILGILPRRCGEVRLLGQPLDRHGQLSRSLRQQIAYLPQNFLFDRRIPMTVAEFVGLGWDHLGLQLPWVGGWARRQAVRQALEWVAGLHLRDKLLSELSGGETKRVLLAGCLVRPRQLLILDEAPAGLDVQGEVDFYDLLYQLKQNQGWTILQISHDLEMVRQHCNRVICLNRRILCQGVPEITLASETLTRTYGPALIRYQHRHG